MHAHMLSKGIKRVYDDWRKGLGDIYDSVGEV